MRKGFTIVVFVLLFSVFCSANDDISSVTSLCKIKFCYFKNGVGKASSCTVIHKSRHENYNEQNEYTCSKMAIEKAKKLAENQGSLPFWEKVRYFFKWSLTKQSSSEDALVYEQYLGEVNFLTQEFSDFENCKIDNPLKQFTDGCDKKVFTR